MASRTMLLVAIALLLWDATAMAAVDPAPRGSPQAVGEQIRWATGEFRKFTEALGLPESITSQLTACEAADQALENCDGPSLDSCAVGLQEAYRAATILRDSDAPVTDRASGARLATETAEALHLLRTAQAGFSRGHCASLIQSGRIPAQVRLLGDGQTLRLRPIIPLRMGRNYALELIGATPEEKAFAARNVLPRASAEGTRLPRGTFALPLVQSLPAHGEELPDRIGATNLLREMENTIRESREAGAPTVAGFQLRWPRPLESADFERLRFRFVPQKQARPNESILVFPTRDDRQSLIEVRQALVARSCKPILLEPGASREIGHLPDGEIYRGRIRSLRADDDNPDFAREPEVTFRLALPRGFSRDTALVLLVHGHGGSSERSLRKHGADLLSRGLAAIAIDLPDHGGRGGEGQRFFDPRDPAGLASHIRQSAIDVVALVDTIERCGFRQPNTWEWRPREVLYLGYSVGAMVGILARSIEPRIGTTVLLAAGGDLPGWMMLHTPRKFHPKLLSCIGGPDSGLSCLGETEACRPPGQCGVDPFLFQLAEQFTLPFAWAAAGGEPLAFATERTGPYSQADVLLFTGGNDYTLHPLVATRLGDALGMRVIAPYLRRGPGGLRVQKPELGHELREDPLVRQEATNFLATRGRQRPGIPYP